jgi:hypothetical protein
MENLSNSYVWVKIEHFFIDESLKNFDEYCEKMENENGLKKVAIPPNVFKIPKCKYRLYKVIDQGKALKFFFDYSEYIEQPEKY